MQSFTEDHHRRWDIAQRQPGKPKSPAIYQHPLWAIDNKHQLGDVREVLYPHNWFAYIKMLHESSTRLLTHDADFRGPLLEFST